MSQNWDKFITIFVNFFILCVKKMLNVFTRFFWIVFFSIKNFFVAMGEFTNSYNEVYNDDKE
jgi:hypothetical protein